jgi:signal transduction histidine kinase
MSSASDRASFLRRVDVRLGAGLALTMGALLVALMSVFFLIATHETAELMQESVLPDLRAIADEIAAGGSGAAAARAAEPRGLEAARRVSPDGRNVEIAGRWPAAGRFHGSRTPSFRLAFASPSDHWLARTALPDGEFVEGVSSLAEFSGERREQLGQITWSLALGLLGVLAASLFLTRLALSPLRAATAAVEDVDERNLDARIAVRGTRDPLDRHARALNHVLARLEQAFLRISVFSADVAHELRTPVNRLLNLVDVALVKHGQEDPPPLLVAVRDACEDMRRRIDDLLFLALAEDGKLVIHVESVDLVEVLAALRELYAPACEERKIDLELRAPAHGHGIPTDRRLLERAISNGIDNALRHTPAGGRIVLAVEPRGDRAEIVVCDSGPGIPASERERVFDRFVQLDPARSGGGAGLGLSLVRTIARLLGGEARVEDSALGGAALCVTLPAQWKSA